MKGGICMVKENTLLMYGVDFDTCSVMKHMKEAWKKITVKNPNGSLETYANSDEFLYDLLGIMQNKIDDVNFAVSDWVSDIYQFPDFNLLRQFKLEIILGDYGDVYIGFVANMPFEAPHTKEEYDKVLSEFFGSLFEKEFASKLIPQKMELNF